MSAGLPKTVLHVVDGLGLSGKTRHLVSLASRLDRQRFRPIICRLNDEPSPLLRELETSGIPVYTIECRDGVHPGVVLRLAKAAWSVNAEIIHCYNARPMLYGGLAARVLGIRAAIGGLSAFACQVPDRSYAFLPQRLVTASRRNVYRNRLAVSSMRFVVSVSRALGHRFCRYNNLPLAKLRVIAYGADVRAVDGVPQERARELRRSLGFRADDVVIGSVGRLVEQKDYPTLMQAFALASRHAPRLRMAVAGDGPLRSTLERLSQDLGIADRVRFLGSRDDVPALLRSVDLFALSSKFEPFGVALLEAKAAGLPIVATAVNEIPRIVSDGHSGFLAPAADAAGMAALFVTLATDPERRSLMGAHARAEAKLHSLESAVAAYESLYEESLAR